MCWALVYFLCTAQKSWSRMRLLLTSLSKSALSKCEKCWWDDFMEMNLWFWEWSRCARTLPEFSLIWSNTLIKAITIWIGFSLKTSRLQTYSLTVLSQSPLSFKTSSSLVSSTSLPSTSLEISWSSQALMLAWIATTWKASLMISLPSNTSLKCRTKTYSK